MDGFAEEQRSWGKNVPRGTENSKHRGWCGFPGERNIVEGDLAGESEPVKSALKWR